MTEATDRGRFLWHELSTCATLEAAIFYPRVVPWRPEHSEQDPTHVIWHTLDGPMGTLAPSPQIGGSPHWLPYVGTPDVADTIAQIQRLGGRVLVNATETPNGDVFAVVSDPQHTTFGIMAPAIPTPERTVLLGEFSWHDLAVTDLWAVFGFYEELFGWSNFAEHDMGTMGTYLTFARNGRPIGGMYEAQGVVSPQWLCFVRVAEIETAAKAAEAAGGRIDFGPMQVPGGDWLATIVDPQGAVFAVHMPMPASASPLDRATIGERKIMKSNSSDRIFIVHGRAEGTRRALKRFLADLGKEPIVLAELASGGRTIIEKFEHYARDVKFAIVLLTPDDIGGLKPSKDLANRARQNVIFELGYFIGRLGRGRVCLMCEPAVELPSDLAGVVYIPIDDRHQWGWALVHEFLEAKIDLDAATVAKSCAELFRAL